MSVCDGFVLGLLLFLCSLCSLFWECSYGKAAASKKELYASRVRIAGAPDSQMRCTTFTAAATKKAVLGVGSERAAQQQQSHQWVTADPPFAPKLLAIRPSMNCTTAFLSAHLASMTITRTAASISCHISTFMSNTILEHNHCLPLTHGRALAAHENTKTSMNARMKPSADPYSAKPRVFARRTKLHICTHGSTCLAMTDCIIVAESDGHAKIHAQSV